MTEPAMNELFVGLLIHLHHTAWVQLGKVANPGTGKVERNLAAAKETIDVLGALEEKSKGNLHAEEEKLLTRMLLDLRMNYVEETKQGVTQTKSQTEAGGQQPKSEESPTPAEAGPATGASPPTEGQSTTGAPPPTQAQSPTATASTADAPAASEGPDKT